MPASFEYVPPSWNERCKAAKIMKLLRDQFNVPTVREMIGLKNVAYVSWLEHNQVYSGKKIPRTALNKTLQYYELHKNQSPFNGVTL